MYNLFSIKKRLGIDEKKNKHKCLASFWIYSPPVTTTVVSLIQLNPLKNPMMWVVSHFTDENNEDQQYHTLGKRWSQDPITD